MNLNGGENDGLESIIGVFISGAHKAARDRVDMVAHLSESIVTETDTLDPYTKCARWKRRPKAL